VIGLSVGAAPRESALVIAPGSVHPRDNGRHPGGRPPKLDQEKADLLREYLRLGEYLEIAAEAAGIDEDTFRNWKRRAAEERELGLGGPFVEFFGAIKKCSALAQIDALAKIQSGAEQWQAAAWFKERTSHRWRRRLAIAEVEDEHEDDEGFEVRVRVVSSRPADPVLDVAGSSRITEEQHGGISGNGNGTTPH
jgi:transposase-like protein